ncbi:MAG TPA: hypothetical protein VMC10_19235 [Stellaceae bacterium]|nr:hypothetical protein [Stellaceae bacterium]
MRILAAALTGALLLGAPMALAQSDDHDSYKKQAEDQVELWKQKLGDAGDKVGSAGKDVGQKASATGKDVGDAADKHLKQAWHKTQEAADKLQNAGDKGWGAAKAAYERASHDLARTWNKLHSD